MSLGPGITGRKSGGRVRGRPLRAKQEESHEVLSSTKYQKEQQQLDEEDGDLEVLLKKRGHDTRITN